ncbi:MAG: methionine--tRNA ligase [Saprospiraceae bacterium]
MVNPSRYLITSALPYANGPLHIGHLAGAYLSADIYVRYLRMMDKDVVWVCGSDEHGAAITIKALKENTTPKAIIDKYHDLFQKAFEQMNISFDIYHRTSEKIHHETSQEFFSTLYDKGEFIEKESDQYYDEEAQQFLADRYIKGECPRCGKDEAYGDQCENCGSSLSPSELINPMSTLSGSKPVLKSTRHWYLPLDKYNKWLDEWITSGNLEGKNIHDPSKWKNHVIGQCKSWLDTGLISRSMTRDLDWGVDVPHNVPGHEGKKLYVWLDAPIGYISATKQWAIDNDKDWEPYWKDENTALIHFIGKDNIVFHCLIFPSILKAHGGYILPVNVPANQFVNLEGQKISTSKNWAVWVNEYVDAYPERKDELRYHMIKIMPEQKDSEFTWQSYQDSINNELVNNLANFVNRVTVLTHKYYDGLVPEFDPNMMFESPYEDDDLAGFHESELLILHDAIHEMNQYLRDFDFRSSLRVVLKISQNGNQLLQMNEPWKAIKDDKDLVNVIINLSLQIVTVLSIIVRPFLPLTSDKLRDQLGLSKNIDRGSLVKMLDQLCEGELLINEGHRINKATHLFSRIPDEMIETEKAKLVATEEEVHPETPFEPIKENIEFADFIKLDLRTATILSAEKVEKTDKLIKMKVDMGFEKRTIVSGIAEHYKVDQLVGKKIMVVANLAPKKLRGVMSQGMILLAEDMNGKLQFVSTESEFPNGMVVK